MNKNNKKIQNKNDNKSKNNISIESAKILLYTFIILCVALFLITNKK